MLAYIAVFLLLNFFFFPTSLLLITAGAAFGIIKGSLLSLLAMILSMLMICILGQYFLHETIHEKLEQKPRLAKIVSVIERKGIPVIFLLRMSPIVSFSVLSYLVSLIKVPLGKYLLVSIVGLIFPVITYIYIGAISSDILAENIQVNTLSQALKYIGLGMTLLVTLLVARIAQKSLKEDLK